MPTEKEFQAADIWLAEQMDECVHEYTKPTRDEEPLPSAECFKCAKCNDKVFRIHYRDPMPLSVTPRSKDLGMMVNVCHKIRQKRYGKHIGYCFSVQFYDGEDVVFVGQHKEMYKDHKSPDKAAAWAIVEALRKVKK